MKANQLVPFVNVPWCIDRGRLDKSEANERQLWAAFVWASTMALRSSWPILNRFPRPPESLREFSEWYEKEYDRLRFDTDCRYRKPKMVENVRGYLESIRGRTQAGVLRRLCTGTGKENFERLWAWSVRLPTFGRYAAWNHVEAIAYLFPQYGIDAPTLKIDDVGGSESHRNGVCWVIGREDLVTHHGKTSRGKRLTDAQMDFLVRSSEELWIEAQDRLSLSADGVIELGLMNLETVLCYSKKMMSRGSNGRYLNWRADYDWAEIIYLEEAWPELSTDLLWEARRALLPETLRCENYPAGWERGPNKSRMRSFFERGALPEVVAFQRSEYCPTY